MKSYEIIEHTADIGIKVWGKTLKQLFQHAAMGMFYILYPESHSADRIPNHSLCSDTSQLPHSITIKKELESFEELLVYWLSELLYIFNTKDILFSRFNIVKLSNGSLNAQVFGKEIDISVNPPAIEIKAVTFHNLKIQKDKNIFYTSIIFDV